MNEPAQGSVVLVDFTYSDQVRSKVRPALVVSNSRYNTISRDVIVMKITTRKPKIMAVSLTNADLMAGSPGHPAMYRLTGSIPWKKSSSAALSVSYGWKRCRRSGIVFQISSPPIPDKIFLRRYAGNVPSCPMTFPTRSSKSSPEQSTVISAYFP